MPAEGRENPLLKKGNSDAFFREKYLTKNKIQKKLEIEKNDERNIAIANRAKGKAFDMMTFVYGALMVSFALMGIDMVAVLLLVFAYLFVHGFALYYRFRFDKEM